MSFDEASKCIGAAKDEMNSFSYPANQSDFNEDFSIA
jgi:hypothetical protein